MTVRAGEGRMPALTHVQKIARDAGIVARRTAEIVDAVQAAVSEWPGFATDSGVSRHRIQQIQKAFPRF